MGYDGYGSLRIECEGGVATVTMHHPPINLLDRTLLSDLYEAVATLGEDESVRVVVLRSDIAGFFLAHFDANIILSVAGEGAAVESRRDMWLTMCERLRTMPKATIALIDGRAGGGGNELALACDMRFATIENAIFNQWEVAVGLVPGGGGLTRLARLTGRSRALEVILGCDDVSAQVAAEYGWINRALPSEHIDAFVMNLTRRIAAFPPQAVATAKEAVLRIEHGVAEELAGEHAFSSRVRSIGQVDSALAMFLRMGGQTVEGERRLGELLAEVASSS